MKPGYSNMHQMPAHNALSSIDRALHFPRPQYWLLISIFCVYTCIAQNSPAARFNFSYWDALARKKHLTPAERNEFLSSHRRAHVADSLAALSTVRPKIGAKLPERAMPSGCVNSDFEGGSTAGWSVSCGFHPGWNPMGCCPNPGGQQTIMTGAGLDPSGNFPVVFPGGNFSLRLGNNLVNGQADRIEQVFQVTPSNASFSYKYAVVLEDPGHNQGEQPFFQIDMLDGSGNPIPCGQYYVSAGAGIPGFSTSPVTGAIYKPWSTVFVDLTPYMGQNVTIRFSVFDCALGGHFGYAYIDGVCAPFVGGDNVKICSAVPTATSFCGPAAMGSYTWSGPGVNNGFTQCLAVSAFGVYTVNTTLPNGCVGPTFTFTYTGQNPPVVVAGPANPTICASAGSVALSGTISGYAAQPFWSTGGSGVFQPSVAVLSPTYVFSSGDIAAGQVSFTLVSKQNGVCPADTDRVTVYITSPNTVQAGPSQTLCMNTASVSLSGTVAGQSATGQWVTTGTGTFLSPATSSVLTYFFSPADALASVLHFSFVSTNNGVCAPDWAETIVVLQRTVNVDAGPDRAICATQKQVVLQGTVTGGSNQALWSGGGSGTLVSSGAAAAYTLSPGDVSGDKVCFALTSLNSGVCPESSDTMCVRVEMKPIITVRPDTAVCEREQLVPVSFAASVSPVRWMSSGTGVFVPGNGPEATHYQLSDGDRHNRVVYLSVGYSSSGPCAYTGSTVKVKLLSSPKSDFVASSYVLQNPGDQVVFTNASTNAHTYSWNFGDGLTSTALHPSHRFNDVGYYHVTLHVKNNNGCDDISGKTITVQGDVQVPNAFTPNPDGPNGGYYDKNDYSNNVFFPFARGVVNYHMMIFNRFGELIFQSFDLKIGWDGYFNGRLCQQDTYVWKIDLRFFDGRKFNGTGRVSLIW